jgi:hypothetical protein
MTNPTFEKWSYRCPPVREQHEILLIDISGGKVNSVVTADDTYDFDWCARDERYYHHNSGSGIRGPERVYPGSTIWAADSVELQCEGEFERLVDPPHVEMIIEMLESCSEHQAYYCPVCRDTFPDEDLCQHMAWCDECGMVTTPNEYEQCSHHEQLTSGGNHEDA